MRQEFKKARPFARSPLKSQGGDAFTRFFVGGVGVSTGFCEVFRVLIMLAISAIIASIRACDSAACLSILPIFSSSSLFSSAKELVIALRDGVFRSSRVSKEEGVGFFDEEGVPSRLKSSICLWSFAEIVSAVRATPKLAMFCEVSRDIAMFENFANCTEEIQSYSCTTY
jgi:hypothetical protein